MRNPPQFILQFKGIYPPFRLREGIIQRTHSVRNINAKTTYFYRQTWRVANARVMELYVAVKNTAKRHGEAFSQNGRPARAKRCKYILKIHYHLLERTN